LRSTNLDFDWFYRKLGRNLALAIGRSAERAWQSVVVGASRTVHKAASVVEHYHGPTGTLARTWPTGSMAFWTTFMLAVYLILSYL
jgi:multicomponent Na+:H+ antiporter subunit D